MGIKTVFHEFKAKVSPSRLFKALVTDIHDIGPKAAPHAIKSVEIVEGSGVSVGCVVQTNFTNEALSKSAKHRIDSIDTANYASKYTLIDGDVIGDKIEKICYDIKFEATDDGGCVVKRNIEYHTKGDVELTDDEINADTASTVKLFKACEAYLDANPHACA